MILYLLVFIVSLSICAWITPVIRKISLKRNIIDRPGFRKIHGKIITRLGGVAIYVSFFTAASIFMLFNKSLKGYLFQFFGLFLSSTLIFFLGIYDDLKGANATKKFTVEILAAIILISFGIKINIVTNPFGGVLDLKLWSIPLTLLWLVLITNAVNLIDGLDGLAAGVSSIISLTLFLVAIHQKSIFIAGLAAALAGSSIGFLRYNFNPAKIFMGDSGSLFLGFMLAAMAIKGQQKSSTLVALLIPIMAMGYPIIDTLLAIIRRTVNKSSIFRADEEHIHHKLLKKGLNHKKAVLLIYAVTLCLGAIAFFFTIINDEYVATIMLIIGLIILVAIKKLGFIELKNSSIDDKSRISQKR